MAIAFVLVSILTGALSTALAALVWEAGLLGAVLSYWLGGMAGAMALFLWAALRPDGETDQGCEPDRITA
ncbi:hypothetical protein NHN26_08910 [Rhodovulum tesquicola]|uniref:hypothetical protein n=1 Tax=Rhodovulum tesquicola TaxID=540254 RepID=UPI002096DEEA|nr:hypothetical protein [Rhodovulum tesquicola]MCO8145344.1 hypothetical protein [Rhodovulum tesquicola]